MKAKDIFDLTGKTAVVTRGIIGLGAQVCAAWAEAGVSIAILAG